VGRLKIGSFGFANGLFVCRAKPNVPIVRWQKNKKMRAGQKLNLSGSVCVSPFLVLFLFVMSLYFHFLTSVYKGCSVFLPLLTTFWRLAQWRISEHKTIITPQKLMRGRMFN